jgi:hypothetical protein
MILLIVGKKRVRALLVAMTLVVGTTLVASCREPTQISVEITTDVRCSDVKGTSLTVGNLSELDVRPITTQTTACTPGEVGRVGNLVVVPSGADDDIVAVRVVLGFGRDPAECIPPSYGPGCIVARRALRYIPHAALTVPIFMSASCSGVVCGATETCVRGDCRPATIEDSNACSSPGGCGENVLGAPADAGAPLSPPPPQTTANPSSADASNTDASDAAAPPPSCPVGTVCDVVTASAVVDVAVTSTALFWLDSAGNVTTWVYWSWQGGIRKRTK